jgi:transposase IS4-like protein
MAQAVQVEGALVPPVVDRIALGALTSTFPPELVDRVLEQTGRVEQRRRLLPARVVVYYVLALALFASSAYEEVMRCLVEGLGWARPARRGRQTWPHWQPHWHVPGAAALGRPAPGWVPNRCAGCSSRPPGRWPPGRPGARGSGTGGC